MPVWPERTVNPVAVFAVKVQAFGRALPLTAFSRVSVAVGVVIKVLVIVQIADSPLASVIEFDGGNINAPFWQV